MPPTVTRVPPILEGEIIFVEEDIKQSFPYLMIARTTDNLNYVNSFGLDITYEEFDRWLTLFTYNKYLKKYEGLGLKVFWVAEKDLVLQSPFLSLEDILQTLTNETSI